jgi:hypothetical protein
VNVFDEEMALASQQDSEWLSLLAQAGLTVEEIWAMDRIMSKEVN